MADLIDRQAAYDTLTDYYHHRTATQHEALRDALSRVPSAQPERKTGRWKEEPDPYGFFDTIPVCSECGCTTTMRTKTLFCPHCGADMRGESDG